MEIKSGCQVDVQYPLGDNYYVSIKKGYNVVDIRRWWVPENEHELKPTKVGITIQFNHWDILTDIMSYIEETMGEELKAVEYNNN